MSRIAYAFASLSVLALLSGCGGDSGGGGGVTITPPPAPTPTPTPTPAPTPTNFNTAEYQISSGASSAKAINAYQAGASGAGVLVTVIDSGVDTSNSEFATRISSLSQDTAGTRPMGDDDGHGTSVAGILLAARNNSGIMGVAYEANLLAIRADDPNSCFTAAGCQYPTSALADGVLIGARAGSRVINLSLGGTPGSQQLRTALANATAPAQGALVVVAAGNEGAAEVDPLAASVLSASAAGTVIIAGAVDSAGAMADFSNRAGAAAPSFLTALGVDVRSFDNRGVAFLYSGTSEATPIISGAAALLIDAFPNLTSAEVVDLLLRTADDLGAPGTDAIFGRGRLNIQRAFAPIGSLTVSGVADPLAVSAPSAGGILGGPLGDAASAMQALSSVVARDSYSRAYSINIGATLGREPSTRLAAALLGSDIAATGARLGDAALALTVSGLDRQWRGDLLTGAAPRPGTGSRLVQGQAALPLPGNRLALLGFGQSPVALLAAASGARPGPANMAALSALEPGFAARHLASAAIAQPLGAWTASLAVAGLEPQPWLGANRTSLAISGTSLARPARAQRVIAQLSRGLGAARFSAAAELLVEQGSLLGSRLSPAFGLEGATTSSALFSLALPVGGWSLQADGRIGHVSPALSGTGLVQAAQGLTASAASLSLTRPGVLAAADSLSLTIAQPMRLSGSAALQLGQAAPLLTSLAPSGREIAVEASYAAPLTLENGPGWLSLGMFWRHQPGHVAAAPADAGAALRLRLPL